MGRVRPVVDRQFNPKANAGGRAGSAPREVVAAVFGHHAATLQQADGKAVKKAPTEPMTAIGSPKLYLFTPELIHGLERIGVLEFKLVPQGERG